jgi:List-Bact-rpt repeat protein
MDGRKMRTKFFLFLVIFSIRGATLAGQARSGTGVAQALSATGPVFSTPPPDPIDSETRERQRRRTHLPTPLMYATTQNLSTATSAPTLPQAAPEGAFAANDFVFEQVHDLSTQEAPLASIIGEPSLGSVGSTIFYTGNWYAARSTDGGKTFTYVSPYSTFPFINRGFCCDQVVHYAPAQNMMLWALMYIPDSTSGTLRIARANGSAEVDANSWKYWDFNPQDFGFPSGNFMDFPNMTVASTYLYVTANVFRTSDNGFSGSVLFRIPLSALAAGGSVTYDFSMQATVGSLRCAEGATTTMYCGAHIGGNQVRIYRWEDAGTITSDDVLVAPFNFLDEDGIARTTGGSNWAGRADSRISGAWVANGLIGLMWNAKQGGSFPYPYSVVARFIESTRAFIDQTPIWSSQYAWLYPTVSVNASGNLAGIIYFGGGTQFPTAAVWINDDVESGFSPLHTYVAAESDAGPSSPVWGDFFTARRHPIASNTWVGGVYYLHGGGNNENSRPRYLWFGRVRDFTSVVQVTVQTSPPGLQITVDGTTYTSPQTFNWFSGTNHTIATTTPQVSAGTRNVFATWSDGGAVSHSVSPTVPATYTANFTTQYFLTTTVSPAGSGTITRNPSSIDGYYDAGAPVQLSAVASTGYAFTNWTGDLTGTTNPQSFALTAPKSVTANFDLINGTGLRFVPVTPCRVADTRLPNGPLGGPVMAADSTRHFQVQASACGIPSTAMAYALNVTAVPAGFLDYLTIWPTGQQQPFVSTLNSYDGRIKANAAIVAGGANGAVSVYVTDETDVILDINGYFTLPANAPGGLVFYPVTPCRVMDTRLANGPLGGPALFGGTTRTVPMVSSSCGLPAAAAAYSVTITAVPVGSLNYVTTWPTGTLQPFVSTLNAPTGTVVANAAIVPAGSGGSIDMYATDQTHLIIDVNGYFAPAGTGGLKFYPLTPCRVVDTRNAVGPFGGPALSGSRDFSIPAGSCAVPALAKAYSLNATAVPPGVLGYLTLWATGQPQPFVSTLNSWDGAVVSNAAIVSTTTGSISASATDATDLILDLNGYFAP